MQKTCMQCRKSFFISEGEEWKKICLDCWKKSKKIEDKVNPRIKELEAKNARLHSQIETLQHNLRVALTQPSRYQSIEPEMLRRIIMLCHPDRHDNSPASGKATQYLLDMKK